MRSCKAVFFILYLSLFFIFCFSAHAVNGVIDDIHFQSDGENSESVVFHLNGASLPKAFALKGEKPRVVFDFIDTQLAETVPSVISTDGLMVEKIRMGRHSDKTRVVLDLVSAAVVNFEQDFDAVQNILTIHLYSTDYSSPNEVKKEKEEIVRAVPSVTAIKEVENVEKAETVAGAADDPLSSEALLSGVKFENTSNKGEMVLFTLNGFYPPQVSGQGNGTPKVTCVFTGTQMDPNLIREQTPQGKFIRRILVEQVNKTAPIQVTLELVPNKNYDLQQVFFKEDNFFVIMVNSFDAMATSVE